MRQVVLVGMLDSVHTVRWLRNWIEGDEVEITLVPSGPHRKIHPELLCLMHPHGPLREIKGASIFGGLVSYALDKLLGTVFQLRHLEAALSAIEGSEVYLHYLETQHSGYMILNYLNKREISPVVVGSNWGSDLYWFGRFRGHRRRIMELLERTDKYLVECERDYVLAKEMGYKGEMSIVGPNSFTYVPVVDQKKESLILVKGYQGWAGRSHTALRALGLASQNLRDFTIVVYSADPKTRLYCKYLARRFRLRIEAHEKHHFSQEQMQNLFSRASVYIGASRTDGISTSALEAMNHGVLPIQTRTSCIGALVQNGVTGFTPDPTEPDLHSAILGSLELINGSQSYIQANRSALQSYAGKEVARARFEFAYDL